MICLFRKQSFKTQNSAWVKREITMGITIKMTNTKISDNAKVMNNMTGNHSDNINIEMDGVQIGNTAEILNNLTDTQTNEILYLLKEQAKKMHNTEKEYQQIIKLLLDIDQEKNFSPKQILKQHMPDLLTGTLANIISSVIL